MPRESSPSIKEERHCTITEKETAGRLEAVGQPGRKPCTGRRRRGGKEGGKKCKIPKVKIIMSKRKEQKEIYI